MYKMLTLVIYSTKSTKLNLKAEKRCLILEAVIRTNFKISKSNIVTFNQDEAFQRQSSETVTLPFSTEVKLYSDLSCIHLNHLQMF